MLSFQRNLWNPWKELAQLQHEMNRSARRTSVPSNSRHGLPPVNVWKGEDGAVVTTPLPGFNLEDIDISVLKDTLTIRVQPPKQDVDSEGAAHQIERFGEPFTRTIVLPFEVEAKRTEAKFEKGVLTVKLHRPDSLKPTKVVVQAV